MPSAGPILPARPNPHRDMEPPLARAAATPRLMHVMTVSESLGFLTRQVCYVRDHGFEVAALTSPGPALGAFGRQEGIETFGVEMPRRIMPLHDLGAVRRVWARMRAWHPDIVHAHTPKGGLLGMTAAALAGVPVRIYHIHGLPFVTATGARRALLRTTEWVSCRLATHVLCVSPSIRALAVEYSLCPPGKAEVPGHGSINGIDAARFDPDRLAGERASVRAAHGIPDTALVIGFVGRIVADKGVRELAEAWHDMRDAHPDLHLLLVGAREDTGEALTAAVAPLTHDPRVHWHGQDWETPRLYAAMDVVTLPSYREGFGVVALEAAAMRLPIVSSRIPGCVDAVQDGRTGTLVPAGDGRALAEALSAYLLNPALRRQHGEAGRARVLQDFRPETLWAEAVSLYERLLGRTVSSAPDPS